MAAAGRSASALAGSAAGRVPVVMYNDRRTRWFRVEVVDGDKAAPVSPPFSTDHYAAGFLAKLRRAAGAGPAYYFCYLPRYLRHRRRLGLMWDAAAWTLPLREFRPARHHRLPLPPAYGELLAALAKAGVKVCLPPLRFEALAAAWWSARDVAGDVIECGSYEGASALALAVLGRLHGKEQKVLMLDTFHGLPPVGETDAFRRSGEFEPAKDQILRIGSQAARLGVADRIEIHAGLFADSFTRLARRELRFAFVHVDANVYEGTDQACAFTLPRAAEGGVVVFDDYNGPFDLGARLAIDRHLAGRPEALRDLAWSSAWIRISGPALSPGSLSQALD